VAATRKGFLTSVLILVPIELTPAARSERIKMVSPIASNGAFNENFVTHRIGRCE
jgi:hypothetical protein